MILDEDPVFGSLEFSLDHPAVDAALEPLLTSRSWFVLGYAELPASLRSKLELTSTNAPVDNLFRLDSFEQLPAILTLGIRASRFAAILFWEAFHALATGGVWVDVDYAERCRGTAVSVRDHVEREYYEGSIEVIEERAVGPYRIRLMRKTAPSRITATTNDDGWTFGILTAGPSPNAERMVREILALELPAIEIVICGPKPANLPDDARIRQIDLEKPEPRGWITKKKNMIAEAARYENLCILHDRFFMPGRFVEALRRYGNVFSVVTFPQVFYADRTGTCIQRYPDYQVVKWSGDIATLVRAGIFDGHYVFHPQYNDFHETAFCCGGLYITKKTIWNLVRQDEALFHAEWEDAVFGYECQKIGIPHRVNPYACVESANPHPMLLTAIHVLHPSGKVERAFHHVSAHQRRIADEQPGVFQPLLTATKKSYCAKLVAKFNRMPIAQRTGALSEADFIGCDRLSEVWSVVHARVSSVPPQTRTEIFGIFTLISDVIFNHPACVLQHWTREAERALTGMAAKRRFSPLQLLRDALTFSPKDLLSRAWRVLRPARGSRQYAPIDDVIAYFREVETCYPVAFVPEGDGAMSVATVANRERLLDAEQNFRTIFFQHRDGLLPRMDGWEAA